MLNDALAAVTLLVDPTTLVALLAGVVVGTIIGVLPGLGPSIAIALALPFTLNMSLGPSVALLMGLYCTSIYGGSVAAILLNVPGTPASAATCFDGYPMARRGDGDLAIGITTIGSAMGGMFSIVILAFLAPFLARFALRFGPLEMFLVGVFALCCVAIIERAILVKAVAAGLVGMALASIGQDPASGDMRLTFGYFPLAAGIPLVPLLMGLFAISEVMMRVAEYGRGPAEGTLARIGFRVPGLHFWRSAWRTVAKSSLIGIVLGILPGAGPTAASFISYSEAKRSSKDPDSFGKGNPEGILASEAANNAVTGGALVPSLSLGIPGDPITAMILAALVLQGVTPGPRLYTEHMDQVLLILFSLFIANIGILVAGGFGARLFTRVLRLPEPLLLAGVVVLASVGTFAGNNSAFDLVIMAAAGFLGWGLRVLGFPLAPLIIGYVLAPMVEVNFKQALIVYGTDPVVFLERPVAAALLVMILGVLLYPTIARAVGGMRRRIASR
ncbi:tripartite tricarboxylate transporter permease [Acuticoccus mangrovi]|uniref:Tripartite tricarboxylate transporter permease n=1 Tax=Acuticoccus mangrovi TaxID=2796142 RepID=A0A934IQX1_9HYPH|nr:tripartite tricarboxylate transporter permease [Acuticoccus mangrovi]MBJ3776632.1 tripartite tricarboxylate transporter permease [Acuticoccus mangrovi]